MIRREDDPESVAYEPLYLQGIEHFNRCDFFEAHEVWEGLWAEEPGPSRRFYQGLIQVAVAFYHLRQENFAGARRLLAAGLEKLSELAPQQAEVDLGGLLTALEPLRERIQAGDIRSNWPAPQILSRLSPISSTE